MMSNSKSTHDKDHVILFAEDDPDDRFLIEEAFRASSISGSLFFVENGEELLDYLLGRKRYAESGPRVPMCVFLDLRMHLKNGREALKEIRQNPKFADLPILVLSTSDTDDDKEYCSRFGVTDYIKKPDSFTELITVVEKARKFCLTPVT